jgi:integrase
MAEMQAPAAVLSRDRVLSDQELAAVWQASQQLGFPFSSIYRLLIATMQRREEVGGMQWAEIDFDQAVWSIPAARAKNGVAHDVPLNDLALSELRQLAETRCEGLVFSSTGVTPPSGWSKAKARLDVLAGEHASIVPWRTHDLRRTGATGLQRLGVRFEVIEAVLNHLSGARSGVAGVYQRHSWASEKRHALASWSSGLERLIRGSPLLPQQESAVVLALHSR